jgi:hypothetical protein
MPKSQQSRSRIHVRTVSLRFLVIILKALRLEVSVYNVYITNQFQTTFAQGRGGGKIHSRDACEYQEGKLLRLLSQLRPRIRPLGEIPASFNTVNLDFHPNVQYHLSMENVLCSVYPLSGKAETKGHKSPSRALLKVLNPLLVSKLLI